MESQPSLFEQPDFQQPELSQKVFLAKKLSGLASRNVFVGTSSWRYEGWLGQIYTPERYYTRGRFSKKKFHEECIQEYAEVFPIVGGDFSFYAIPEPKFWQRVFADAPPHLKWSLKVPEEFTVKRFSNQERHGPRRGLMNPAFLDADAFQGGFLEPLAPYLDRIAVLIFEFGTFSKLSYSEPNAFLDELDGFVSRLPGGVRYCIEIRNEDFLIGRYFEILHKHRVAHTFASWTRMPSLKQQLLIAEAFTAPHTVARALLRPGRSYEEAVHLFSPYNQIKDPYLHGREALVELMQRSMLDKRAAFIHVNNRFEGNSIQTIAAVVGADF